MIENSNLNKKSFTLREPERRVHFVKKDVFGRKITMAPIQQVDMYSILENGYQNCTIQYIVRLLL